MKYPHGDGLFDTPSSRPDGAQPLVWLDVNGRPCYSPAFALLPDDDQAAVRAQGERLVKEWTQRLAAQPAANAAPVKLTNAQELIEAIGEAAAALLAVQPSLNRLAGAVRAFEDEQARAADERL